MSGPPDPGVPLAGSAPLPGSADARGWPPTVSATGLPGLREVTAGDDVAGLVLAALAGPALAPGAAAGAPGPGPLSDGDIVVVSSKVISKAEGRAVRSPSRDTAVASQTVRVVAERITPRGPARIVRSHAGPVMAAAGVDASNVAAGTVLLLPQDADDSARRLRARLTSVTGRRIGVLISDTLGRPWREGQTDAAIGAAGVSLVEDLRGGMDPHGNPLEVTVRAVGDEIAALADLVKGKLSGIPVAVVRGLGGLVTAEDGPGASTLVRPEEHDWFRYGHQEAVRAALGVPPGGPGPGPAPVPGGTASERLDRAAQVALAWPGWAGLPIGARDRVRITAGTAAPGAGQPGAGQPGARQSGAGQVGTGAPGTEEPGTGAPGTEPPGGVVAELVLGPGGSADPGGITADLATDALALGVLGQRLQAAGWAEGLTVTIEVIAAAGAGGDQPALRARARLTG